MSFRCTCPSSHLSPGGCKLRISAESSGVNCANCVQQNAICPHLIKEQLLSSICDTRSLMAAHSLTCFPPPADTHPEASLVFAPSGTLDLPEQASSPPLSTPPCAPLSGYARQTIMWSPCLNIKRILDSGLEYKE